MVQINIFLPLMDRYGLYGTVSIDLYSIGHLYMNLQIGSSFLVRRIYSFKN